MIWQWHFISYQNGFLLRRTSFSIRCWSWFRFSPAMYTEGFASSSSPLLSPSLTLSDGTGPCDSSLVLSTHDPWISRFERGAWRPYRKWQRSFHIYTFSCSRGDRPLNYQRKKGSDRWKVLAQRIKVINEISMFGVQWV